MGNILEVKDLTKIYPGGIVANYNINFGIKEGEIHALVGENGAGKSTLMKMLFGVEEVTSGEIYFKGNDVRFNSSKDAINLGIGMVHQHFMLVPSLTVAQNLTLGCEHTKLKSFIDEKKCLKDAQDIAQKYNFEIDATKKVRDISIGMKQKLEILKALYRGAKVLILDEPTAVLTPQETKELFEQLLNLKKLGYTIIFISHKLNEVKYLCDRLTVLKSGRSLGTYDLNEVSEQEISKLMVGRDISLKYDKEEIKSQRDVIKVRNISYTDKFGTKRVDDVSFTMRDSEILGIAGIEGNGQSEIVKILAGTLKEDQGSIEFKEKDILKLSVLERRNLGLSYISEDRMTDGCAQDHSVSENMIINDLDRFSNKLGILDDKLIEKYSESLIQDYKVKCFNHEQTIKGLSGGNIQKVIVAREFTDSADAILINQPTRGVDVGAMEFIHKKILEMRSQGKSMLLVSADLTELIGLSDRILVFNKGRIVGYVEDTKDVVEEQLGMYMLGIKEDSKEHLKGVL